MAPGTSPALDERTPVALVTGAARGIGSAIARRLRADGWRVVAGDIDENALAEVAPDDGVLPLRCDVSDPSSIESAVDRAVAWGDGLDLVVNNAGIGSFRASHEVSLDEWNRAWAINVTSVLLFGRYAHTPLSRSSRASIVNIASDAAFSGVRDRAAYCATKGAVVSLTRAMAADFVDAGIRVNAVAPSAVDSEWLRQRGLSDSELDAEKESLALRIPIGRLGRPDDIAGAVAWLASSDASFITGSIVTVDGGANSIRMN